ncbi:hypothetical protein MPER_05232 [Moniliophthora perniciosa FA553]|nr:hypothetical protein MPER_05232 [Moniliophthora perniciosa FA553]
MVGEALVKVDEVEDDKLKIQMVAAMQSFCPTFEVVNTGSSGNENIPAHQAGTIIGLYKQGTVTGRATDARLIETYLEVKTNDLSKDGFDDNADTFAKDTQEAAYARARMATYTRNVMATQFRTHLFSVWIFNKNAGLILWDRGGAIVSQKFDYAEEPHLADFPGVCGLRP